MAGGGTDGVESFGDGEWARRGILTEQWEIDEMDYGKGGMALSGGGVEFWSE